MQMADEVPESSGAGCRQGSGRFWCRWLMRFQGSGADFGGVRCRRFRKVPGQIADEVPERSGADSRQGSGGSRTRKLMRFRRVPVRCGYRGPVQMGDEVPEGSGADSRQGSRLQTRFRRVPVQVADEVTEGSGADKVLEGSRWLKFRMVPVQIANRVADVSGARSKRSTGGFRYKNLPRSSKLLGITHEFIFDYI